VELTTYALVILAVNLVGVGLYVTFQLFLSSTILASNLVGAGLNFFPTCFLVFSICKMLVVGIVLFDLVVVVFSVII
jgi:hypothetical protein